MGSGASAENARTTVSHMLTGKPADASDITDLEQARAEIRNLRRIARDFQNQLREELKAAAGRNGAKKREAVYDKGEMVKSSASYVPKVIEKPKSIRELLMSVVTTNILFSSYANEEHNAIVDAFESREIKKDVFVIRQGENGDHFYVVQSGTLDVFVKGKDGEQTKVGTSLGPGSCFGELALMYNTPLLHRSNRALIAFFGKLSVIFIVEFWSTINIFAINSTWNSFAMSKLWRRNLAPS